MRYEEYLLHEEIYQKVGGPTAVEVLCSLVDRLIESLYRPSEEVCFVPDRRKLKKLGMDGEAINWGDLHCYEVRGTHPFVVYVEEAAPDSINLKNYLENWLKKWGWDVVVIPEW